jgi:hypothetical protein
MIVIIFQNVACQELSSLIYDTCVALLVLCTRFGYELATFCLRATFYFIFVPGDRLMGVCSQVHTLHYNFCMPVGKVMSHLKTSFVLIKCMLPSAMAISQGLLL